MIETDFYDENSGNIITKTTYDNSAVTGGKLTRP